MTRVFVIWHPLSPSILLVGTRLIATFTDSRVDKKIEIFHPMKGTLVQHFETPADEEAGKVSARATYQGHLVTEHTAK